MENINAFDILITLIKACQENCDEPIVHGPEGYGAILESADYLLAQSVRQLWNRDGHRFVSVKAAKLWDDLKVEGPIFDYCYQKPVHYKNEVPVHVKGYTGAKGTPDWEEDLKYKDAGDCFRFRQVFHIEHIVPINVILKELINLDLSEEKEVVYEKMDAVLNKIYVCYMTKEEDRTLNRNGAKTNRPDDYREVLDKQYKEAGIEVVGQ